MDVVELAMHEVAMRGVAMLHDCLYTLRYTPPVLYASQYPSASVPSPRGRLTCVSGCAPRVNLA